MKITLTWGPLTQPIRNILNLKSKMLGDSHLFHEGLKKFPETGGGKIPKEGPSHFAIVIIIPLMF